MLPGTFRSNRSAQVAAQGLVGVNQWQLELVGGKYQGVVGAVEVHRQPQFVLVPLGLSLGRMAERQVVRALFLP